MSAKEKLLDFINYTGQLFEYEEFDDPDLDFEVERNDDPMYPYYSTDLVREETNEVYRFCLQETVVPLEEIVSFYAEQFRELEAECGDEYDGVILLVRPDVEEAEDFWYLYRVETGEIGFFHSDLSLDDDDEEEEEDESGAEEHTNGHKLD